MKLQNRIAIVTSAARGIGLAIAGRFANEGAKVTICDVDDAAGEAAAKKSALPTSTAMCRRRQMSTHWWTRW